MEEKKTVVLFDIDGTLLLSGGAGNRAIDRAFRQVFSLEKATEGIEFVGMTDHKIFNQIISRKVSMEADEDARRSVIGLYLDYLKEEVSRSPGFRVLPGARDLMEALSSRKTFHIGLVTGNFEQGAWIKLKRAGLDGYFSFGGFGEDGIKRGDIARAALKRSGISDKPGIRNIYLAGDSRYDVLAAQEIGARAIAVGTDGTDKYNLKSLSPDFYFDTFSDSEAFITAVSS